MEPETLKELAILGGSASLTTKLLGPTADYIGEGIKNWAKKRKENVGNIFLNAQKKLGDKIETKGGVSPKVLKGILDEGSFCEDFLATEYFGGVLASSRSGISRDDRGATFIALISRLSTYQIRTHYIFYHIVKNLFDGTSISINLSEGRTKMETCVPFDVYFPAMEFDEQEKREVLLTHIMFGLQKESLIEPTFGFGPTEVMRKYFKKATTGINFQPSILGVELFLWAYGKSNLTPDEFLNPANQFELDSRVNIPPGHQKTRE